MWNRMLTEMSVRCEIVTQEGLVPSIFFFFIYFYCVRTQAEPDPVLSQD